jgi:hypothetical protein
MRNRQYWGVILLAVGVLAGCDLFGAGVKSSFTVERATVEQVLQTESNGLRFVAYVVTWSTGHIVVSHRRLLDQRSCSWFRLPGTTTPSGRRCGRRSTRG